MPDKRKHRGPHPHDADLFRQRHWPALQAATADLSWLLTRDYSLVAANKLVGDRYGLRQRQRLAVQRSACSDQALAQRQSRQVGKQDLADATLHVDGLNLLMTVESALSGAVIIAGRDACYRDMASVHGTFRIVQETLPALTLVGEFLKAARVAVVHWWLDSPVSNSGRLAGQMRQLAADRGWNWQVQLVTDPDAVLQESRQQESQQLTVSSDSVVLDGCGRWANVGRWIIDSCLPQAAVVPMTGPGQGV
jgi:hypothetical protein